jgi:hypothetical protein
MGELISFDSKERLSNEPFATSPEIIIEAALALSEADQYKVHNAVGEAIVRRRLERDELRKVECRKRDEQFSRGRMAAEVERSRLVTEGTPFIIQVGSTKKAMRRETARRIMVAAVIITAFAITVFVASPRSTFVRQGECGGTPGDPACG